MVSHQTPGEYPPVVGVADFPYLFDELFRLIRVVKNKLAASDAAIHVIDGSWNKEAGFTRHGIPPKRGRDKTILLSRLQKARLSDCEGWHPEGGTRNGAVAIVGTHVIAPTKP